MKEQALFFGAVLLIILIGLIVVKTIYFLKATRKRTLKRWLFFSRFDIVESSTKRIEHIRSRQNVFTVVIVIYALIAALVFYLLLNDILIL